MGAKSSSREGTRPYLIGIHTNEGPNPAGDEGRDKSAENLCRWMDGQKVSYHDVVDDDSVVDYVPEDRYAWAMRSANRRSLNLCFIGRASFSRAEWLRHDNMLRMAAARVRGWCDRYGIPRVKLTPADVGRDKAGICAHGDWTIGKRDGSHTDPGPNFPWDVFMGYVNGGSVPAPPVRPAPPVPSPAGSYSRGDRDSTKTGGPIWRAQDKLRRAYRLYAGHIAVDGIFGSQTEAAIREFQKRSRLPTTGVLDPTTWAALRP